MEFPNQKKPSHNEKIREYVMKRDNRCCQWPGCGSTLNVDVLFLIETDNGNPSDAPLLYKNGVTLCPKHMEIVNLHDKAFGPLIFDLIQLVEFERDLQETEKVYKEILNK
ncbi:MAG: hypothetical protein WCW35_04010 [Bacteroidota bacterium]|jgi:hypothetical protein